jgi:hypothetical protein
MENGVNGFGKEGMKLALTADIDIQHESDENVEKRILMRNH